MMPATKNKECTTDLVKILQHMFVDGNPEMEAIIHEEDMKSDIAQLVYDLRTAAGLSEKQLARKVGAPAEDICRLEDTDYECQWLGILHRIAEALDYRIELRAVQKAANSKQKRTNTRATKGELKPLPKVISR